MAETVAPLSDFRTYAVGRRCILVPVPDYIRSYWVKRGGVETHTLTINEMPTHNHSMHGELATADKISPQGNMLALTSGTNTIYAAPVPADDRTMADSSIGNNGGNQPFPIRNPFQAVNFIIALQGVFPSRS